MAVSAVRLGRVSAMGRARRRSEAHERRAAALRCAASPAPQARRSAASWGHLLWSRSKVSRALPTGRPYRIRQRGAPRGCLCGTYMQHPCSTIASDEASAASSPGPCGPRGCMSQPSCRRATRSQPRRDRAGVSGPRSKCGASTCGSDGVFSFYQGSIDLHRPGLK